jgi:hypothetical protein
VKPTGFAKGLDVREKEESRIAPEIFNLSLC